MKTRRFCALLALLGTAFLPLGTSAQTQEPTLTLSLKRDFGYAGGGQIQGRFTATAQGPDDITSVSFWIDDELMGSLSQSPYRIGFSTGDYALGVHTLFVTAQTASGTNLQSEQLTVEFVSAETSLQEGLKLAGPILAITLILLILGSVVPALSGKRKLFELGSYSAAGGAVCVRCGMPFSRSLLAPNLFLGKLERCPHCGRWAFVRRASRERLEAAEERYRLDAHKGEVVLENGKDDLRRELEDSRFEE
jgi:hypothetical protein